MATSDSYDFSLSRDDIIQDALENIGVLGEGLTMNAEHINKGNRKLNMLIQQISSQADFGYGRKIWARKRGYLFLESGKVEYNLGPAATDDHWADSYSTYTVNLTRTAGFTIMWFLENPVSSGVVAGDHIVLELDNGTWWWTTVSTNPTGTPSDIGDGLDSYSIVLSDALPSPITKGRLAFVHPQSKAQRPQRILTVVSRNIEGEDTPVDEIIDLKDYEAIVDKDAVGQLTGYHVEPQVDNIRVLIDQAPEDLSNVVRITYHRPIADFDSANDTPDFPKIYYRYITAQLAIDLAPTYGRPVSQELMNLRNEARDIATHEYAERTAVFFEPDRLD